MRAAVKCPVIVKLTAAVTDLRSLAEALVAAGADGFCTINSFPVILGVDLKTHSPLPVGRGQGQHRRLHGPRAQAHRAARHRRGGPLGKPISGCGGIAAWEDAAEFVLLGATTLQVCSAVMLEGYDIITDLCDGLSPTSRSRAPSVSPISAAGRSRNVVPHAQLDASARKVSSIDLETCTRCGKCAITCRDAGYQAIGEGADRTPSIDETKCDGCGLCAQVCPVWDCIRMKHVAA